LPYGDETGGYPCDENSDCDKPMEKRCYQGQCVTPPANVDPSRLGPACDDSKFPGRCRLKICDWRTCRPAQKDSELDENSCGNDEDCNYIPDAGPWKMCREGSSGPPDYKPTGLGKCEDSYSSGYSNCAGDDDCNSFRCDNGACKKVYDVWGWTRDNDNCDPGTLGSCIFRGCCLPGGSRVGCENKPTAYCDFLPAQSGPKPADECALSKDCGEQDNGGDGDGDDDVGGGRDSGASRLHGPTKGNRFAKLSRDHWSTLKSVDRTDKRSRRTWGKKEAPITIYAFQDLKCGMCKRAFDQSLQALRDREIAKGQVKVVFVEFPLGYRPEEAQLAEAALCAGEQGKYVPYLTQHYLLMRGIGVDSVAGAALLAGVELREFSTCVAERRYKDQVKADFDLGAKLGIEGTPQFYVSNGRKILDLGGARPVADFREAFQELKN
jgi:protein-disulfide isomerase